MARKIPQERVGEIVKAVLTELINVGGEARLGDLLSTIEPKLNLNEYELHQYASGFPRWRSLVHFYSINCVKAGYIIKSGGKWRITTEGKEAIKKSDIDFFNESRARYREWKRTRREQDAENQNAAEDIEDENDKIIRQTSYDDANERANQEIENHISNISPYEFQHLVADLLSAMGYHIRETAPPGPDGGIDIIAYADPLGSKAPRIIVQVKHRQNKATAKDMRELDSLLRKEGDVGLFVSSGGFTSEGIKEAKLASRHIDTIDLDRLKKLWKENYDKISELGKKRLPLAKLYFLAPPQENS